MTESDVLIAGGGPAGLVTALFARRTGLSATVVEPRTMPIDKACGEGLMPPALVALSGLGVHPQGRDFVGIRFRDEQRAAVADFRHGRGRGVRRVELHDALHRAAVDAGVDFVPTKVTAVEQDADGVSAAGVRARYLVAADGLHSPVRHALRLDRPVRSSPRWGLRAHFACAPWTDRVEVHWSRDSEAYVTPVSDDCVGIALLGGGHRSFDDRLREFPALAAHLPARPAAPPLGAGPLRQRSATRVAGRVLFVGDAAGYVDALTGEGLAIAFACARAAVARIGEGRTDGYERDYRRLTRRYRMLTTGLLAAAQRASLRRGIVPLACRAPRVFERAVNELAR